MEDRSRQLEPGLVQVYTGDGKGKTTASMGLALRAVGAGLRVGMVQFIKGRPASELISVDRLSPEFEILQAGKGFVPLGVCSASSREHHSEAAHAALYLAWERMQSGKYDVIILDEINCALSLGLLSVQDVLQIIEDKPRGVELVLTGRGADPRILEIADLVTEMREIKHPFREGIAARRGIDF